MPEYIVCRVSSGSRRLSSSMVLHTVTSGSYSPTLRRNPTSTMSAPARVSVRMICRAGANPQRQSLT